MQLSTYEQELTRFMPSRILLVDDNALNQRVASALLRRRGYSVVVVGNGRDAIEAAGLEHFDAVLMDIEMPGIDGFSAAAQIRNRERLTGEHVPIIAMTAHELRTVRERCRAVGIDDEIEKPIEPSELYLALEACPVEVGASNRAPDVVFDATALLERCEGDHELAQSLVNIFIGASQEDLDSIRTSLDRHDAAAVRMKAHGLKGAAANMSAQNVSSIARSLELLALSGQLDDAETLWESLCEAVQEMQGRLRHTSYNAVEELVTGLRQ